MPKAIWWIAAASAWLSACAGDSGGRSSSASSSSSSSSSTGGGGITDCVETPSDVALDEVTELGFSATDVLSKVGGRHDTDLTWRTSALYATNSLAGTTTALTFTLLDGAQARFIHAEGGGCPPVGEGPCILCDSRLAIDVDVEIVAADGSLNETLAATMEVIDPNAPAFRAYLTAADVAGSYLDGIEAQPRYQIVGLAVEAHFDRSFPGSQATVPNAWQGFVAALLATSPSTDLSLALMQGHGYFPKETAGTNP